MKVFFLLLLPLCTSTWAAAGQCGSAVRGRAIAKQRTVVARQALVVTPFAVPVAVPVATIAAPVVLYSYRDFAAPVAEPAQQAGAEQPSAPQGLVARKCAGCHGGEAPKGGLDLTDLGALDAARRLEAIRRVVSDDPAVRMPKGQPLSPAEIGAVLQELSGR